MSIVQSRDLCRKSMIDFLLVREMDFTSKSFSALLGECVLSGRLSAHQGHGRNFSLEQFTSFFILLILFGLTITAHGDKRSKLPSFQDVEAALESTRCTVRDVIVDIRDEHPSLPPDAKYMPSCVLLKRCSGCCQSERHRCMPTSIYSTRVEVSEQIVSDRTFKYVTLNFTHHAECTCQSPINPSCIPRVCSDAEVWNKSTCRCDRRCLPRECGHRQQWNPETCRCQCQQCHPNHSVHSRFYQDEVSCLCVCRNTGFGRRCKTRTRYDYSQCTCVPHDHWYH